MAWETKDVAKELGGYADWSLNEALVNPRLDETTKAGLLWLPVFVKLVLDPATPETLQQVVNQLVADPGTVLLAAQELIYLQTEISRGFGPQDEIRTVLYCQPKAILNPVWTVEHVGDPVKLNGKALEKLPDIVFEARAAVGFGPPVVAVIDDGIGYLNARFRSDLTSSRFNAVWIQAALQLGQSTGNTPVEEVHLGRVLLRRDIEAELQSGRTEGDLYAALNEELFKSDGHRSTDHRAAHGTLVLDAAGGAAFDEDLAGINLLGVQVPATAVGETSGRRLDPYVLLGLRWVINQTLHAVSKLTNGQAGIPLIINLSLGSLAGPKNGKGFVESWIQYELNRFRRLSANTPIRLVAAYGNARRARLVARTDLAPFDQQSLDWRIQSDDATASFLELRVPKGANVTIRIDPPAGVGPLVAAPWPGPGAKVIWPGPIGAVAAVYGLEEGEHQTILIAVAATVRDDARSVAPAGCWRVTVANLSALPVKLSAKVQRDDTPYGYRRRGRQSWLDDPDGWNWDAETQDWTEPGAMCPVRRAGTGVAFAGIADPAVYFVAAAEPGIAGARAARYSAEGEPGGETPTLAARADDGRQLRGRRGAGVVSGGVARLSGTSGAAPRIVRKLVELSRQPGGLVPLAATGPHDPAELAALLEGAYKGPLIGADRRLGAGVIPEPVPTA